MQAEDWIVFGLIGVIVITACAVALITVTGAIMQC